MTLHRTEEILTVLQEGKRDDFYGLKGQSFDSKLS